MPITNYRDIIETPLFEGQPATTEAFVARTGVNDDTLILNFGLVAIFNPAATASKGGVILPNGAGGAVAGILVLPDDFEARPGYSVDTAGYAGYPFRNTTSGFASQEQNTYGVPPLAYAVRGVIGVRVETAIASITDPVYFRHTAPGAERRGALRNDDDGGNAELLPNARWVSTGSANSVLKLALNLA